MKGPAGFAIILNALMNVLLGVGIGLIVLGIQGAITPLALFNSLLCSFVSGFTIGSLIPCMTWAQAIARVLHAKGAVSYVITAAFLGAFMGLFIGLVSGYISVSAMGFGAVLGFYSMFLPVIIGSAAVLVVIFLAPMQKIAASISGFDPTSAPVGAEA